MLSVRCLSVCLSVCNVRALWPNGWTDQDETWHAGRPQPWPHCVRWGPSSPFPKGAQLPIFGPYLLQPNGCMDQDGTWYGARPRPRRLCVRWGPHSPFPKRGWSPSQIFFRLTFGRPFVKRFTLCYRTVVCLSVCLSVTLVYCDQTVSRIKMKLGVQVGLVAGHIVLDGDPAPSPPKGHTPNFRRISVAAKWLHRSKFHLVWR